MPDHVIALYAHPVLISFAAVGMLLMTGNVIAGYRTEAAGGVGTSGWMAFGIGALLNGAFLLAPVSVAVLEAGAV